MKPFPFHPHILKPSESSSPPKADADDGQEESPPICSACEDQIPPNSPIYTCPTRHCDFTLHKSCFELPRTLQHMSHQDHELALRSEPPPYSLYYDCNACGSLINAFSFHCDKCDFRTHVKCAFLPDSVDCKAHKHPLSVRYQIPDKDDDYSFVPCDVCDGCVTEGYWCYYCKDCNFCSHLECAFTAKAGKEEKEEEEEEKEGEKEEEEEEKEGEKEEEEEEDYEGLSDAERLHIANIKAMDQMARLNFQMQMAELNARTISMMFRTTID